MTDFRRASLQQDVSGKVEACVVACAQACREVEDPSVAKVADRLIGKEPEIIQLQQKVIGSQRQMRAGLNETSIAEKRTRNLVESKLILMQALERLSSTATRLASEP
ncbi:hypothetical protein BSKO_01779 [Bryopsis sp. KO-2023]|nr:hypothetical protein BSKO_01779 [Bryopsis sp. KO-2023]